MTSVAQVTFIMGKGGGSKEENGLQRAGD